MGHGTLGSALTATLFASLWFSWVALLICCLPTLIAMAGAPKPNRLLYLVAGVSGAIAGEFCGVASLFLGLWFYCFGQSQCNTAQGDMGLIITVPAGSLLGCLFALFWTHKSIELPSISTWAPLSRYSGDSRIANWACALGVPVAIFVLTTVVFAWLLV